MKYIITLILILILNTGTSVAQHWLNIQFLGSNSYNAKLSMFTWINGKEYILSNDSLVNGKTSLLIHDSIRHGMLGIAFNGNVPLNQMTVIYSGDNINIKIEPSSNFQNFQITGTGETPFYYLYRQKIDSISLRIYKFQELIYGFEKDKNFREILIEFFNKDLSYLDDIYLELNNNYKHSLFIHYLNAVRYYYPDLRLNKEGQLQSILSHFFDYFNPEDTVLLQSSIYNSKIGNYLELAVVAQSTTHPSEEVSVNKENSLIEAVNNFMQKISDRNDIIFAAASLMRTWLNKSGFDNVLEYIDINYLASLCNAGNDINLQERLTTYKRLAPGKKAPEIIWSNSNKKVFKLSDSNTELTLVIFWATWCPHCNELLPIIFKYLKEKSGIKIITIALDENENTWEQSITAFPGWTHLRAAEMWNNEYVKDYGISATPQIFMIDKEHKIKQKVKNIEDLKMIIN